MVYAGGHVSGGHYNPAVTLAVWLRGRCPAADVPSIGFRRFSARLAASFITLHLKDNPTLTPTEVNVVPALIAEFIGTFALAYVVLNVATAKATAGNSNYGLAIGFTVMVMAYALGGISGGAFNPAVAVGITLMHLARRRTSGFISSANFAAGALAAVAFKFINPGGQIMAATKTVDSIGVEKTFHFCAICFSWRMKSSSRFLPAPSWLAFSLLATSPAFSVLTGPRKSASNLQPAHPAGE